MASLDLAFYVFFCFVLTLIVCVTLSSWLSVQLVVNSSSTLDLHFRIQLLSAFCAIITFTAATIPFIFCNNYFHSNNSTLDPHFQIQLLSAFCGIITFTSANPPLIITFSLTTATLPLIFTFQCSWQLSAFCAIITFTFTAATLPFIFYNNHFHSSISIFYLLQQSLSLSQQQLYLLSFAIITFTFTVTTLPLIFTFKCSCSQPFVPSSLSQQEISLIITFMQIRLFSLSLSF